ARLEILVIQKETKEKRAEAARLAGVLRDSRKRWAVVTDALAQGKEKYADARRTKIGGGGDDVEYSEEAFIADEDAHVVLTRDGWVKRVREMKDPSTTRRRQGEEGGGGGAGS